MPYLGVPEAIHSNTQLNGGFNAGVRQCIVLPVVTRPVPNSAQEMPKLHMAVLGGSCGAGAGAPVPVHSIPELHISDPIL